MECGDYFINPQMVAAIAHPSGAIFVVFLAGGHELRCNCGTAERARDRRDQLAAAVERGFNR